MAKAAAQAQPASVPNPNIHQTIDSVTSYLAEQVPQGSSWYYATRFIKPIAHRQKLHACFALAKHMHRLIQDTQDPRLAAVKLCWWRDAILASQHGEPSQHPVLQALPATCWQSLNGGQSGSHSWLERLLQGLQLTLHQPGYFTMQEWQQHSLDTAGSWGELQWASLQATPSDASTDALRSFCAASMQLTQLLRLPASLQHGQHPIPVECLQQAHIPAQQLHQRQMTEPLQHLLITLGQTIQTQGEQAWQSLPDAQRRAMRPMRAMWRMRRQEWRYQAQEPKAWLTQSIRLTPWRKFSIAWSTHALKR